MELLPLDYALLAVMTFFVVTGLFRGISGELGGVAGFAAAIAAGFALYDVARSLAASAGFGGTGGLATAATATIDLVFILIAYGIVRKIVSKFVSVMVPQPTNAVLGALGGCLKSAALVALLSGVWMLRPGEYSTGPLAAHSTIVSQVAAWADSFAGGGAGE